MTQDIFITSAVRTPIGNFQGSLKDLSATDLGAIAIKGAIERSHLSLNDPQMVIMGCVLPAGLGQAPARQAALKAGLPTSVDCTTINKMCGSGMKSIMLGFDILTADSADIIIAGGMESMTNAPYLLPKARAGYRLGHQQVIDHMFFDGLEDAYEKNTLMGVFADRCAATEKFSREQQDNYALTSLKRASFATENNIFKDEIVPVTLNTAKGELIVEIDDGYSSAKPEKIPLLRPAFSPEGTVTAANSSSISDGAAALTLMRRATAEKMNVQPIAKILAHATHSQAPHLFTTAPVYAIEKLLHKLNWQVTEVDLWEINEAFAVVTLNAIKALNLPEDRVNIHGGGCVLGHPIGASGARIVVTLINALKHHKLKRGVAALCIGGGEATAIAIELI
ncbi:MAG: acetyl-CoA C-acyltransferase [Gammaproteobacteria bacterium]|nr:acetyl-CoA C-acyltransferase [Gammaproteobacteria bacterium]